MLKLYQIEQQLGTIMVKNSSGGYGLISIAIHWLSALVVIGMYILGFWMMDLDYYSSWYQTAPHIHKSLGILLALLIVFRIVWKGLNTNPKPMGSALEQKGAHAVHGFMYLLLMVIFISGYLISTADGRGIEVFNWFTVPSVGAFISNQEDVAGEIHEYATDALMLLVLFHALAALFHHFVHKDLTLVRMLKPTSHHEDDK